MRNITFSLIGCLCLSLPALAQDEPLKNKKGQLILPQKGDFGLGFNAVPILNFIGNSFNGQSGNNIGQNKFISMFGQNTVFGKYFLTDKSAIRIDLGLNIESNTYKYQVVNDLLNSPDSFVVDKNINRNQNYTIGAGHEWRLGKGRLQGILGAGLFYSFSANSYSRNEYGNAISEYNMTPTSALGTYQYGFGTLNGNERMIEYRGGKTNRVGARLFAGVEYFVAPKISLGAEFGWMMRYTHTSKSTANYEFWDTGSSSIQTKKLETVGGNSFNMNMDNFNGAIYLMFHF